MGFFRNLFFAAGLATAPFAANAQAASPTSAVVQESDAQKALSSLIAALRVHAKKIADKLKTADVAASMRAEQTLQVAGVHISEKPLIILERMRVMLVTTANLLEGKSRTAALRQLADPGHRNIAEGGIRKVAQSTDKALLSFDRMVGSEGSAALLSGGYLGLKLAAESQQSALEFMEISTGQQ